MKKLLSVLSAVAIVGSSAATVVSCGKKSAFPDIYLVTDTGKVDDKSFNQSSYEAGNAFAQNVLGLTKENIAYTQPATIADIPSGYQSAAKANPKAVILPGFNHSQYLEQAKQTLPNAALIGLDLSANNNGKVLDNFIGLQYRADQSGLKAGLASIIWYVNNVMKKNSDNELNVATFGGQHNPIAVDSYMGGMLASVEVFNDIINNATTDGTNYTDISIALAKAIGYTDAAAMLADFAPASGTAKYTVKILDSVQDARENDPSKIFSGNFKQGDATKITDQMVNDGADIIFPVAGPQTADALGSIRTKGKEGKTFIVGVDIDQTSQYSADKNDFITSATKTLKSSTLVALSHTNAYKDNFTNKDNETKLEDAVKADFPDLSTVSVSDPLTGDAIPDLSKPGTSWEGKDVWFDGGYEGGKIDDTIKNSVKQITDLLDITNASTTYINAIKNSADAKGSIGTDVITAYVNNLLA